MTISKKLLKDIQETMLMWHGAYESVLVDEYDEHGCAHVTFTKTNGESIVYKTWNNGFGEVVEEVK